VNPEFETRVAKILEEHKRTTKEEGEKVRAKRKTNEGY
jgi:hypothetical protein